MLVSIITPSLQSGAFLGEAVGSVWTQGVDATLFEHIIVDGGSTDNTMEVLSKYDHLHVISERDRGPGDALNKGLARATGDFILFLMADDRLGTGALPAFFQAAKQRPGERIWTIGTSFFQLDNEGNEKFLEIARSQDQSALTLMNVLYGRPFLHSRFIHRSVFDDLGNFRVDCSLSSDREFMVRCVLAGHKDRPVEHSHCELRVHPGSATMNAEKRNVSTYLREHLDWSKTFLGESRLSLENREILRRWRFHETVRAIYYHLRSKEWRNAAALVSKAVLQNPLWPLDLVRLVRRRVRKGASRYNGELSG